MHRSLREMNGPRRYPPALHILAGALLLGAAACAGGEPLPPGRYDYTAAHPVPAGTDTIVLEGSLEIAREDGDSLTGRWDVPQLHPELRVEEDSEGVVLTAHPTYFGTLHHRVRLAGGRPACDGEYSWRDDEGAEQSVPLSCSISPASAGAGERAGGQGEL